MEDKNSLDLEAIADKCNLYDQQTAVNTIVQNISLLEIAYSANDLIKIYNYFLTKSKNHEVLTILVQLLDKYRDESTLSVLLDLLLLKNDENLTAAQKDKFNNVRALCAKAIANMKNTSAVTPLLYCLNNKDENYKVRLACADALGKIGDKYAVAPLIDVVKDDNEKSVYLRESAASALGMLGDIRAVDPLVSILETKQSFLGKFTFLKERVIEALGKLRVDNNDKVFHALKLSLDDESPQIRINAIEAIMDCEHPDAFMTIKSCLLDPDDEVKKNALIALYNIEGRPILDEILKSSDYPDILKVEAVSIIDEYETEDELLDKIKEELDD